MNIFKKLVTLVMVLGVFVVMTGCDDISRETYGETTFINVLQEIQTADLPDLLSKMGADSGESVAVVGVMNQLLEKWAAEDNYTDLFFMEVILAAYAANDMVAIKLGSGLFTIAEYPVSEITSMSDFDVMDRENLYQVVVLDASNPKALEEINELTGEIVSLVVLDTSRYGKQLINNVLNKTSVTEEYSFFGRHFDLLEIATDIPDIVATDGTRIVSVAGRSSLPRSVVMFRGNSAMVTYNNSSLTITEADLKHNIGKAVALDGNASFEFIESDDNTEDTVQMLRWITRSERSKYGYNVVLELYVQELLNAYRISGPEAFVEMLAEREVQEYREGSPIRFDYGDTDEVTLIFEIGSVQRKVQWDESDGARTTLTTSMSVAPILIENRTWLPVRYVAEVYWVDPIWDSANQQVIIKGNNIDLVLYIKENKYTLMGVDVYTEGPSAQIVDGRTLVPLRLVGEAFGAEVSHNKGVVTVVGNRISNFNIEIPSSETPLNQETTRVPSNWTAAGEVYTDDLILVLFELFGYNLKDYISDMPKTMLFADFRQVAPTVGLTDSQVYGAYMRLLSRGEITGGRP